MPGGSQVGPVGTGGAGEVSVDLAGDGPFQLPEDLLGRPAAGGLAGDVVDGGLVVGHPDQRDPVQGAVGVPVTAAGQPVAAGLARGGRDRRDATQRGERGSRVSRSGLWPAVISSCAATSGPTPNAARSAGLAAVTSGSIRAVRAAIWSPRSRCRCARIFNATTVSAAAGSA